MKTTRSFLLFCSLFLLPLAAGCKKSNDAAAPGAGGKLYAVAVDGPNARVRITPAAGWKMNLEYEHRFEGKLKGAGTPLVVPTAKAKVSEQEVVFELVDAKGKGAEGSVFFAICTKQKCIPAEEPVSF